MAATEEKEPFKSQPSPAELISDVDNKDLEVLMAYSRYLERPNDKRREEIAQTAMDLVETCGPLLRSAVHGELSKSDALPTMLATLLNDMAHKHSTLLADYLPNLVLPSDDGLENSRVGLEETLEDALDEGSEPLIDAALGYLRDLLDSDMEAMEFYFDTQNGRFTLNKLGEHALRHGIDIFKIGTGAATGLAIWDRFLKK